MVLTMVLIEDVLALLIKCPSDLGRLRQYNIINTATATAVGNITPRNTVCIFLLHYNFIQ